MEGVYQWVAKIIEQTYRERQLQHKNNNNKKKQVRCQACESVDGTRESQGDNFVLWFLHCHDAGDNICLASGQ